MDGTSRILPHVMTFTYFVQAGLASPFLSVYFLKLSDNFFWTGCLTALPLTFVVLSAPFWGSLADRYGATPVLFFSFLSTAVAYCFLAVTMHPFVFFVLYCFFNLAMAGFVPAVQRRLSRLSRNQGVAFGSYVATSSFGFFFGSLFSGLLYDSFGMQVILILALMVCLGGVALSFFLGAVESPQGTRALPGTSQTVIPTPSELIPARIRGFLALFFVINAAIGVCSPFTIIFLLDNLVVPSYMVGFANAAATALGTVISVFIAPRISGKMRGLFFTGLVANMLVWGSYASIPIFFNNSIWGAVAGLAAFVVPAYVGMGIAAPAIVSSLTEERERGRALGFLSASMNLGLAAGASLGGFIAFAVPSSNLQLNFAVTGMSLLILFLPSLLILTKVYLQRAPRAEIEPQESTAQEQVVAL